MTENFITPNIITASAVKVAAPGGFLLNFDKYFLFGRLHNGQLQNAASFYDASYTSELLWAKSVKTRMR
jgi:hypothetical protein